MKSSRESSAAQADTRRAYQTEGVYSARTICRTAREGAREYADELLVDKLQIVRNNLRPGAVVDLCCATGGHLLELADVVDEGIGVDFSEPYIASAAAAAGDDGRFQFMVGDAKAMPLKDHSVGTLFCFSSLYAIPGVEHVVAEIARVLRPGGRAILDFGNSRSLNAFCVRNYYTEWPRTFPIPLPQILQLVRDNGFTVIEHRVFQILPLWAGKPAWLMPLLHPFWQKLMKRRVRGRMLDEWISSAPILRSAAFRHILIVER